MASGKFSTSNGMFYSSLSPRARMPHDVILWRLAPRGLTGRRHLLIQFGQVGGSSCPNSAIQHEGTVRTRYFPRRLLDSGLQPPGSGDSVRVAPPSRARADAHPEQ